MVHWPPMGENPALLKHLASLFKGLTPHTILDIGATRGTWNILKHFFPRSAITGLNIVREEYPRFVLGDGEQMPFRAGAFDMVFLREVFEHLLHPDRFLEELKRVLRKEGRVILTTPNMAAWHNRLLLALGYSPTNYTPYPSRNLGLPAPLRRKVNAIFDHPRIFTFGALRELFSTPPFRLEGIAGYNYLEGAVSGKRRSYYHVRRILNSALPHSWREDVILRARLVGR